MNKSSPPLPQTLDMTGLEGFLTLKFLKIYNIAEGFNTVFYHYKNANLSVEFKN